MKIVTGVRVNVVQVGRWRPGSARTEPVGESDKSLDS